MKNVKEKRCPSCEQWKKSCEFYKSLKRYDGLAVYCKICIRERMVRHIRKNAEKFREYDRKYYQEHKGEWKKRQEKSKEKYPEKWKARNKLRGEVRKGTIKRLPCEKCGKTPSDGHHEDYEKPLEVKWLCRLHHLELHRKYV